MVHQKNPKPSDLGPLTSKPKANLKTKNQLPALQLFLPFCT